MSTETSVSASDAAWRARELIPELRERAAQTALDRRLPVANIDVLRRSGALKTIQAKRNGGYALGIRSHLDVMSALGRGCGSTAWVAGVVQAHSWLASHFPEQGQDDIYGDNHDTIVSAVIGPRGKATRTADGYHLEGVWPFGSGCETRRLVAARRRRVRRRRQRARPGRLHGSGIVGDDQGRLVRQWSDRHRLVHDGRHGRRRPCPSLLVAARPHHGKQSRARSLHGDDWVQRCAPVPVLTIALCGGAIGIARQALDDFPAAIKGKVIAYTADPQEPHPFTHIRIGDASSRIREGELLLYSVADELDLAAQANVEVPFLRRAEMRNDCATAVRRLLEGVEILFRESGATGVRTSSPMNRAMADLQTINNHGLLKLETNQEMYGRLLLGLEPNTPLI